MIPRPLHVKYETDNPAIARVSLIFMDKGGALLQMCIEVGSQEEMAEQMEKLRIAFNEYWSSQTEGDA